MKLVDFIKAARERLEKAHAEINALCNKKRFEMSIPVRDTDSDMTLQAPLDSLDQALKVIEKQREALEYVLRAEPTRADGTYHPINQPHIEYARICLAECDKLAAEIEKEMR